MPFGTPQIHDSAPLHVSGRAEYCDDIVLPANALHAAFGLSPVAHGEIAALDLSAVLRAPGVAAVALPADIPGENNYGGAVHDDPIFADHTVQYAGQPLFAVAASSMRAARKAARCAKLDVSPLPAILDIRAALAARSYVLPSQTMQRGDPRTQLENAPRRLTCSIAIGGQDHFYLEGQIAVALPQEDGAMLLHSSTQHPTEVQSIVAHALAVPANRIVVQCRRMGGGFGGKESQAALIAAAAAVLSRKTARPVKLRLDRDADMLMTGKRHDFIADCEVGFDEQGRLRALSIMLASRCGYSADLSGPVNDRAMFHVDNAYYLEHVEIISHRCKTHTVSNTAFRGFGAPQAMMVIEAILDDIARTLGLDPLDVRRINLYGIHERNLTHYGQPVEGNVLPAILDRLESSSGYRRRRDEVNRWNAAHAIVKRGLALTPVKFGISFTSTLFNQAGALLQVYTDGTVLLNHGGTEMGQGLHVKVAQVVATELGLPLSAIRICATDTSKVPNTSATAASSGSDLNGKAAQAAAVIIRERLALVAATLHGVAPQEIRFADGEVLAGARRLPFAALARAAHEARVSLSATGFYRTPKVHWDKQTKSGRPFFYFAFGAAVAEVAIDTLTGETQLLRIDILHDVGDSLNPAIDRGQIEGGFLQGVGWLTSEELYWNGAGELCTHAPSTYKIPTARDWPATAHVELLQAAPNPEDAIYRSKAVGEPPLMLALSVFHAIRDACAACGPARCIPKLPAPATPEAVLRAIDALHPRRAA
ncbi:MAG TPA: xanthine dehydrogenase molybdopterin binding subunit [Steroidobacteraceae bacterium]|nr:xanthine dehydrogenase molybdopterin binding subunit [Steroidobacteraceae bacterium]